VLADPTQLHDGKVWASVHDALPGAVLPNGRVVVAAWGRLTWTARVAWDARDQRVLWLLPVQVPKPEVNVRQVYDVAALASAVVSAAQKESGSGLGSEGDVARNAVIEVLTPLIDDFERVVDHHVAMMDATRVMVRDGLRYLENTGPTKAIRRFLNSKPGADLIRLARYYRPPSP
jgi:hypothetical protein